MSEKQSETLKRLALPLSHFERHAGYPGLPYMYVDMRSIAALERKGMVESLLHTRRGGSKVICYRITEAGRAALSTR